MVEGLAWQRASLSTDKSTEPHDHDSYSDQANVIGVMRKPLNYNLYFNTYNPGWRDHPIFSWSQGLQQNEPATPAPLMQQIPQVSQASYPLFRPYNQNQNYSQPRPWEDAFQNFKNVTHSTIEQLNRTIDGLRNELRAGFNSQAQSVNGFWHWQTARMVCKKARIGNGCMYSNDYLGWETVEREIGKITLISSNTD